MQQFQGSHLKPKYYNWIMILVLLISILPLVGNTQTLSDEEFDSEVSNIEDDMFNRAFDSAIEKIDALLKIKKHPLLYKLKGDAITHHNEKFIIDSLIYKQAIECYNIAIEAYPKYFEALYARSHLNFTHQLFPEAINDASVAYKCAENKKDRIDILNFRALVFTYMRDIENAIQDYKDVLALNPDYDMAYSNLSMLYGNIGEFEKAKDLQLKAIELNPDELKYYNNLSLVYIDLGEFERAESLISESMEKYESPDAYLFNNRGYARIKLGKLSMAEEDIKQSISIQSNNSYAYRNLALLYIEKKQTKDICPNLEKAIELNFTLTYGDEVEKLKKKHCK